MMNGRTLWRVVGAGMLASGVWLTGLARAEGVAAAPAATGSVSVGKIGYVDMERIFQGYYKTVRADASFKKQKDIYAQHATDMATEIEAVKKQRDEQREKSLNIALSDEARAQSRKDADDREGMVREKDRELRDFVTSKDKELGRKYLELRNELVKELSDYIRAHAEKSGFEMVVDVSGMTRNFIPAIVYYPKNKEMTEALLAELNKGHESEIPKDSGDAKKPEGKSDAKPEAKPDLKPDDAPATGGTLPGLKPDDLNPAPVPSTPKPVAAPKPAVAPKSTTAPKR